MEGENNPERKWNEDDKKAFERGFGNTPDPQPSSYPKPKKKVKDEGFVSKLWKAIK